MASYDPRYLAGVRFFNDRDFFEAHEVWEDLWAESHGDERRFYQGLIQAAVGLFHFGNGNLAGAVKLYHSSRDYMRPCGAPLPRPRRGRLLARHGGVLPPTADGGAGSIAAAGPRLYPDPRAGPRPGRLARPRGLRRRRRLRPPMSDDLKSLGDFHGRARLFPLPNLVLFPYVIQPLHIFEERYRQLMDDALKDDRLIAMALLRPGWEKEYHKCPPIHPVICLGRIHKEQRLADGRWNLLLHGLARARVENELKVDRLYRVAKASLVPEEEVASVHTARDLRRRLGLGMERWFAAQGAALEQLEKLLRSELTLGALCDVFSFALPIGADVKQRLLEDADVEQRARRLIAHLDDAGPAGAAAAPPPRKFPPDFSAN